MEHHVVDDRRATFSSTAHGDCAARLEPKRMTKRVMNRNERGAILGIVMMLLIVLLLAAGLAVWGLHSETASAGGDWTARALSDCAEMGLAWGKAYFSA